MGIGKILGEGSVCVMIWIIFFFILLTLFIAMIVWNVERAEERRDDFERCMRRCPTDGGGNFLGFECPEMCMELRQCENPEIDIGEKEVGRS